MINDKEEENKALMFIVSNSIYYVFGIGKILTQDYKNSVGTVSPEQSYWDLSDRTVISDSCQVAQLFGCIQIEFWCLAPFGHIDTGLLN